MLKLNPDPTFWTKVDIPLHGGGFEEISVEYVYLDREQLDAHQAEDKEGISNEEQLLKIMRNWKGVEGPLNAETLTLLMKHYNGFQRTIIRRWVEELMQVRLGN